MPAAFDVREKLIQKRPYLTGVLYEKLLECLDKVLTNQRITGISGRPGRGADKIGPVSRQSGVFLLALECSFPG